MRIAVTVIFCLVFSLVCRVSASEYTLIDSGICTSVVDHAGVGIDEAFVVDVGKLYCFTRVLAPYLEGKERCIEHVWYYQGRERARITLPVKSTNWGTFSSKIIQPSEVGDWRVDVYDSVGDKIQVFQFFIRE
jgi:hypothetical protein